MSIPTPADAGGLFFYDDILTEWVGYICSRADVIDSNTSFIDTSITGSGKWQTVIPAGMNWTARIDGLVSLAKTTNPLTIGQLLEFRDNQTRLHIQFELHDDDGNFLYQTGYAYIEACNVTRSFDNVPTFSISLRGDGQLTTTIGS